MKLRLTSTSEPYGSLVTVSLGTSTEGVIEGVKSATWSTDATGLPLLTLVLETFDVAIASK